MMKKEVKNTLLVPTSWNFTDYGWFKYKSCGKYQLWIRLFFYKNVKKCQIICCSSMLKYFICKIGLTIQCIWKNEIMTTILTEYNTIKWDFIDKKLAKKVCLVLEIE